MSNYCKYLQAFFLPLRLPVAEALWSIEKDCPGKIRHRQLQEGLSLNTHKCPLLRSVYEFRVETTRNYAWEGLLKNLKILGDFRTKLENSGLNGQVQAAGTHVSAECVLEITGKSLLGNFQSEHEHSLNGRLY